MKQKVLEIGSIILVIALIIVGSILIKDNGTEEIVKNDGEIIENNVKSEKNITIVIWDKESQNIYSGDVATEAVYLIDALEEIEELNVVIENGIYGAYITSINEISQGDNSYWTYYIDDEYASVGVSGCEIEEGKTYTFKIEEYNY